MTPTTDSDRVSVRLLRGVAEWTRRLDAATTSAEISECVRMIRLYEAAAIEFEDTH